MEDAVAPQSRPSEEKPGRGSDSEREPAAGTDGPAGTSGAADTAGTPGSADTAHGTAHGTAPTVTEETPGWLAQVPYFLVLATMSAGIVVVAAAYFKRGPALIAGALLLAAAFRYLLPSDRIGMLAVRQRWIDIGTTVTLAILLIVLAWVAPQLSS
ncbi:DUF3017 domain-containing protein [Nocardiopsis rhodophaea]|uniref:DUF3017 domain-containing protein n=1 Tax=Nocardiopsis rhodophaea TaxID=280238 RepID=UPI00399D1674